MFDERRGAVAAVGPSGALYSGQPFPGLAAAITRGSDEDVAREARRIEAALDRLTKGLEETLDLF